MFILKNKNQIAEIIKQDETFTIIAEKSDDSGVLKDAKFIIKSKVDYEEKELKKKIKVTDDREFSINKAGKGEYYLKLANIGFNQSKFVTLCPEVEAFLRKCGGEMGNFIYEITRVTADLDRQKNGVDGAAMNDVLTLIYLIYGDTVFTSKEATIEVEISSGEKRGQTKVSPCITGNATCNVVTGIEVEAVLREVLMVIFPWDKVKINMCLNARKDRLAFIERCIEVYPEKATYLRRYFSQENAVRTTLQI